MSNPDEFKYIYVKVWEFLNLILNDNHTPNISYGQLYYEKSRVSPSDRPSVCPSVTRTPSVIRNLFECVIYRSVISCSGAFIQNLISNTSFIFSLFICHWKVNTNYRKIILIKLVKMCQFSYRLCTKRSTGYGKKYFYTIF